MKSWRFSDYSEFFWGVGDAIPCNAILSVGDAALMRPNKVETRLQLQNGLVKVQKLVGRLAIGWVKRVFMAWSCYFPADEFHFLSLTIDHQIKLIF